MSSGKNYFGGQGGYGAAHVSLGNGMTAAGGPAPAEDGLVKDTTTANFTRDVIQESRNQPVLVDFWAPWCGPCKQLTPVLEKAIAERKGAVKLVKLNIDDHPAIPGQMGIQSIPAVIAFKNGQPVDGFMGALPESQVKQFLDRLGAASPADTAIEDALAVAEERMKLGDTEQAAQIYSAVLEQQPDHTGALAALAGILTDGGALDEAKAMIARVPEGKQQAPEVSAVNARIALAEQVAALGDERELTARLAANGKDHQARFDLAMIENAKGNRETAADHLLAIIRAERGWNDEAARKQLLQFFEAWGMADEATLTGRRKLSSALFA
jgi:putative thioredoxin